MKNKTGWIIGGVVVGFGLLYYFTRKKKSSSSTTITTPIVVAKPVTTSPSSTGAPAANTSITGSDAGTGSLTCNFTGHLDSESAGYTPISEATVTLPVASGINYKTTTDSQGVFSITGIKIPTSPFLCNVIVTVSGNETVLPCWLYANSNNQTGLAV